MEAYDGRFEINGNGHVYRRGHSERDARPAKGGKGDTLFAVETPSGYLLAPYDPAVAEQSDLGREFMAEYRETFRALAK